MSDETRAPAEGGQKIRGANSSRKVLQLLLSFSEKRPRATVSELAEIIGAPVATTYRYVGLLKELHLLEEGEAGRYQVSSRVNALARAAQVVNSLAILARPAMQRASAELGETVMLFQRFGDTAVCVERVECDRFMRFTFEPGHSLPLGFGASGKMMLALLSPEERDQVISRMNQADECELREKLQKIRQLGWAESRSEIDEGVWAISVPIDSRQSLKRPAVLSAAGPTSRISSSAGSLRILEDAANEISASLGRLEMEPADTRSK